MHCESIRIHILHQMLASGKLGGNVEIKKMVKERKFKWKTIRTYAKNLRVEI